MSEWREPEWRIPRKGEVVKDPDGNLGRVFRTEGTLQKRFLWIKDEKDTEIYSGEPAELFKITDSSTASIFQTRRYRLKGYFPGALCSYKGNMKIPLEILEMDWNPIRYCMTFCLKDHREFVSEIMKTEDEDLISPFQMEFPPLETIFSPLDSGLRYRLQINLIDLERDGWTTTGSPWEFQSKEDALEEVENWKSRLMIRRVSSVLNADWKIEFPCWTVSAVKKDESILTRVKEIDSYDGSPGYFRTALHAAYASKILSPSVWLNALSGSQDVLNF